MKGIRYLILILTTLYVAVLYNSAAIVFLAGVEVLLPLLLFLFLFVGNFLLRLSLVQKQWYWEDGQALSLELGMRKRGILPLRQIRFLIRGQNGTTGERYRKRESFGADRGENQAREILLPQLSYGVWRFSMKRVQVFDYLRLLWLPHTPPAALTCVVLPRRHPIAVSAIPADVRGGRTVIPAKSASWEVDRTDRGDIRSYRPGDALNEIHWKLSAKRDQLLVWGKEPRERGGWLLGLDLKGWSSQKAELIYSLLHAMLGALNRGAVVFWRQGEAQMALIEREQDLYLAMENLLSGELLPFEGQPAAAMEGALWVREPLSLWQGDQCLFMASGSSLEEELAQLTVRYPGAG